MNGGIGVISKSLDLLGVGAAAQCRIDNRGALEFIHSQRNLVRVILLLAAERESQFVGVHGAVGIDQQTFLERIFGGFAILFVHRLIARNQGEGNERFLGRGLELAASLTPGLIGSIRRFFLRRKES